MDNEERLKELLLDWEELYEQGRDIPAAELCKDCPELAEELGNRIRDLKAMAWIRRDDTGTAGAVGGRASQAGGGHTRRSVLIPDTWNAPGWGDYRLVSLLGMGGFGEVWKAKNARTGEQVAVKFIRSDGLADWRGYPAKLSCLNNEAKLLSRANHPHIIRVLGIAKGWAGLDTGGYPLMTEAYFVVSELADSNLIDYLQSKGDGSVLSQAELVFLLRDAAEGGRLSSRAARDHTHGCQTLQSIHRKGQMQSGGCRGSDPDGGEQPFEQWPRSRQISPS